MCAEVELEVKKVVEVEQCYAVTRTVCTETVETVSRTVETIQVTSTTQAVVTNGVA